MEVTSRILSALEVTKVRVESLSLLLSMLGDGGGRRRGIANDNIFRQSVYVY